MLSLGLSQKKNLRQLGIMKFEIYLIGEATKEFIKRILLMYVLRAHVSKPF